MRIIHYLIFFDEFDEGNIFTERNSIIISDECNNTTSEIMSFLYYKYYKKYEGRFINCWYSYIEMNKMNKMLCIADLNDEDNDTFFENIVDITHEITFIKNLTIDLTINNNPKKDDVVCCVFDYNDSRNNFYTEVENFVFVVGDNFNNQIKELFENVKIIFLEDDYSEYCVKYINCHYTVKGSNNSWNKIIF
jgi:hypothetical protein